MTRSSTPHVSAIPPLAGSHPCRSRGVAPGRRGGARCLRRAHWRCQSQRSPNAKLGSKCRRCAGPRESLPADPRRCVGLMGAPRVIFAHVAWRMGVQARLATGTSPPRHSSPLDSASATRPSVCREPRYFPTPRTQHSRRRASSTSQAPSLVLAQQAASPSLHSSARLAGVAC